MGFLLFLIIKFVAANPVDVKMQNSGVLINIPDCFPYCGVGSEIKQQLQNTVQSCFPFCGVPAQSMNNLLQVAALPACFPSSYQPNNKSTSSSYKPTINCTNSIV